MYHIGESCQSRVRPWLDVRDGRVAKILDETHAQPSTVHGIYKRPALRNAHQRIDGSTKTTRVFRSHVLSALLSFALPYSTQIVLPAMSFIVPNSSDFSITQLDVALEVPLDSDTQQYATVIVTKQFEMDQSIER